MSLSFHEVLFPTAIALGSHGGPERRTDIVALGSGREESRRRYNAGYGVTSLDELHGVVAFFEERRGRLYGFRWRDAVDFKSGPPAAAPTALDQEIGIGDGTRTIFQLTKTYGRDFAPWRRDVTKPVTGTVTIAVDGVIRARGVDWVVDPTTGLVTFLAGRVPPAGQLITAGFEFHVPVRFDSDTLEVNLHGFRAGAIPNIPIVEVRL